MPIVGKHAIAFQVCVLSRKLRMSVSSHVRVEKCVKKKVGNSVKKVDNDVKHNVKTNVGNV